MPESIRPTMMLANGESTDARWTVHLEAPAAPTPQDAIPLAAWLGLSAEDRAQTGLLLQGWDDLAGTSEDVTVAPMVALHFPAFTDGRSYSHAYRLRRMLDYTGPIVAVGDVLRDQLPYMSRCGIDHFYLRDDQSVEGCQAQLGHFKHHYQYGESIPQNRA